LDEGSQHSFYLGYFIHEGVTFFFAQEAEIASEQKEPMMIKS